MIGREMAGKAMGSGVNGTEDKTGEVKRIRLMV